MRCSFACFRVDGDESGGRGRRMKGVGRRFCFFAFLRCWGVGVLGCRRGGCVRSQISFYRKTKVVSFFPSTEGLEYLLSSVNKSDINFPILTERRELSPPTKDFSRGGGEKEKIQRSRTIHSPHYRLLPTSTMTTTGQHASSFPCFPAKTPQHRNRKLLPAITTKQKRPPTPLF